MFGIFIMKKLLFIILFSTALSINAAEKPRITPVSYVYYKIDDEYIARKKIEAQQNKATVGTILYGASEYAGKYTAQLKCTIESIQAKNTAIKKNIFNLALQDMRACGCPWVIWKSSQADLPLYKNKNTYISGPALLRNGQPAFLLKHTFTEKPTTQEKLQKQKNKFYEQKMGNATYWSSFC